MMDPKSIELLRELTQADAIPGHEAEVRQIFQSHLEGIGELQNDRLGSIFCTKQGQAEKPRILLDSHMDEVGFMVQRVTGSGYIKFIPVGGWWAHTLLAQRVNILTKGGKLPGVIASTPPHLLSESSRNKVLDIKDLYIDIGAESGEQAEKEYGVQPGCPIIPYGPFMPLKNPKLFSAKAFDNRVGVGLVIETLQQLGEHPNTVIGTGSVQEEVGLRGARTAASAIEPDVAIVLEGPPADDLPGFDSDAVQGRLGGGVQIRLYDPTMIANPQLCDLVIETAKTHQILHQIAVRHSGGTDAGAIHQVGHGVPSIVLGVPARYVHSHVSIINIDDYQAALDLLLRVIPRLDQSTVKDLV
ncbi:MAG: M42 family metallopeptidase [Candidatus Poribacteria bacterium]|nr:M42 family metallopeptidase [Candidatus Poribacteria bacterium]